MLQLGSGVQGLVLLSPNGHSHALYSSDTTKCAGQHSCDVTFMATSIGGAEFRPAKSGCQLRQPHNTCVMLDRWIFFGCVTQTRVIMFQAYFSMSMSGLPLLHPFNRGRLPLVVEYRLLRSIVLHGHVKRWSRVACK